jgi:hypothetical protein
LPHSPHRYTSGTTGWVLPYVGGVRQADEAVERALAPLEAAADDVMNVVDEWVEVLGREGTLDTHAQLLIRADETSVRRVSLQTAAAPSARVSHGFMRAVFS